MTRECKKLGINQFCRTDACSCCWTGSELIGVLLSACPGTRRPFAWACSAADGASKAVPAAYVLLTKDRDRARCGWHSVQVVSQPEDEGVGEHNCNQQGNKRQGREVPALHTGCFLYKAKGLQTVQPCITCDAYSFEVGLEYCRKVLLMLHTNPLTRRFQMSQKTTLDVVARTFHA